MKLLQPSKPPEKRPTEGAGSLKPRTLSNLDARKWYLEQEVNIPSLLDKSSALKQQAKQAFELRNQFRTQARDLMSDRVEAESLAKTNPNLTWEQTVQKYSDKGFQGDELWTEIINASQQVFQTKYSLSLDTFQ